MLSIRVITSNLQNYTEKTSTQSNATEKCGYMKCVNIQ